MFMHEWVAIIKQIWNHPCVFDYTMNNQDITQARPPLSLSLSLSMFLLAVSPLCLCLDLSLSFFRLHPEHRGHQPVERQGLVRCREGPGPAPPSA